MFKARFILVCTMCFFTVAVFAQKKVSDRIPPAWLRNPPVASNNTFRYTTVSAVGETIDEARQKCLSELLAKTGLNNGLAVVHENKSREVLSQSWENGKLTERLDYKSTNETRSSGSEFRIHIQDIDEYWTRSTNGQFHMTKLFAESGINMRPDFDEAYLTHKYGARGLWRSAIVPGWGQMYKGSYAKGGIIMGCTVGLAAGIIASNSIMMDNLAKASHASSGMAVKQYQANINNASLSRNLCIGGLAALYVYNLIDAIVAPGARRVIVTPAAYGNNAYGISGHLNF